MVAVAYPYLSVELTGFCNLRCSHCLRSNRDEPAYLPLDLYEKLLDEGSAYRFPLVSFTGGEPTLHPELDKIFSMACSRGMLMSMVTNGWNFESVYSTVRRYRDSFVAISFSLDGAMAETHDAIRGDGSFHRVLGAMSVCAARDIPFTVQMAVHSKNIAEMEAVALLAGRLGAKSVAFLQTQPTPGTLHHGLVLGPRQWVEIEKETARIDKVLSLRVGGSLASSQPSRWYQCRFLTGRVLNIDYLGRLTFCCQLSGYHGGTPDTDVIGSLRDESLFALHRKLSALLGRFHTDLIGHIESRPERDGTNYFPCWYCSKYFDKGPWLADHTDLPWAKDDIQAPPNDSLSHPALVFADEE